MLQTIKNTLLGILAVFSAPLLAQDESLIHFLNPSFEDLPRHSYVPAGWTNCGDPRESPPDVHPDPEFLFQVGMHATDGNTYLGMVTRENETYESVGQQLTRPLTAGQCYRLDLDVARSRMYMSLSRVSGLEVNYVRPIRLQVYGGYSICDRGQLLGETENVVNFNWRNYSLKLTPEQNFTHIILQAYYEPAQLFAYNGNILLDNAKPLEAIPCDDPLLPREIIAKAPENPDRRIVTTPVPAPPSRTEPRSVARQPVASAPSPPPEPEVRLGASSGVIRQGTVFRVENINFKVNSAELEKDSKEALEEIVGFMEENPNVIVEIGGHSNRLAGSYVANTLSQNRAKAVVSYIRSRGINATRLIPQGYGKRMPLCTDTTPECNRRNQRVDVKILKVQRG